MYTINNKCDRFIERGELVWTGEAPWSEQELIKAKRKGQRQ